ncbi:conserved protein of unknown function [Pseudomonas marincola]|uniref:Uncharacterized protein n=1 Tax=Pseudomonas marincola TaxID=437900 RepID=A0A653EAS9_9PSED|nr:hypothetical protein [Pseudomonas marincola]CAE6923734.1 conserved protein of unknown function [Pseudomonas marincola]
MQHDDQPNARETITTLAVSALTLAVMIVASYLTPDLLARLGQ